MKLNTSLPVLLWVGKPRNEVGLNQNGNNVMLYSDWLTIEIDSRNGNRNG